MKKTTANKRIIHGLHSSVLAKTEKNSAFSLNCEVKCNCGSGGQCESLSGFIGGPRGKAFGKFTTFNLKLVWYSISEIIKLKFSVSYI